MNNSLATKLHQYMSASGIRFWLVVLGLPALWGSISVYNRPSPRKREKKKRNNRQEKNVQTTPTRTYCKHSRLTLIQISRTPRHWKFTQHHRTTRPPPSGHRGLPFKKLGQHGCRDIFCLTLLHPKRPKLYGVFGRSKCNRVKFAKRRFHHTCILWLLQPPTSLVHILYP